MSEKILRRILLICSMFLILIGGAGLKWGTPPYYAPMWGIILVAGGVMAALNGFFYIVGIRSNP